MSVPPPAGPEAPPDPADVGTSQDTLKYWATWVDIISKSVSTVAIIIAALWAILRFGFYELPSLDKRLQVKSHEIEWNATADAAICTGKFGITIKNVSKRVVSIRAIQVSVWVVPAPPAEPGKLATYIDPAKLVPDKPGSDTAVRIPVAAGSLTGDYGPDIEAHDDYVFLMPRAAGKIALFRFEASGVTSGTDWIDWQWAYVCNELKPGVPAVKTVPVVRMPATSLTSAWPAEGAAPR